MRAFVALLLFACVAPAQGGRLLHTWTAPDDMPGVATEEITADRSALVLDGKARFRVTDDHTTLKLPKRSFTVAAWVRVDRPQPWGGLVSCLQDNGGSEGGWLLGLRDNRFCLAVASVGADDGDGLLTYLTAARTFSLGGWHHVVGTYDGKTMRLYVDGKLDAKSTAQSGPIKYKPTHTFALGGYLDVNEYYGLTGRVHELRISNRSATARSSNDPMTVQLYGWSSGYSSLPVTAAVCPYGTLSYPWRFSFWTTLRCSSSLS